MHKTNIHNNLMYMSIFFDVFFKLTSKVLKMNKLKSCNKVLLVDFIFLIGCYPTSISKMKFQLLNFGVVLYL